jgi:hypothetical protein
MVIQELGILPLSGNKKAFLWLLFNHASFPKKKSLLTKVTVEIKGFIPALSLNLFK